MVSIGGPWYSYRGFFVPCIIHTKIINQVEPGKQKKVLLGTY